MRMKIGLLATALVFFATAAKTQTTETLEGVWVGTVKEVNGQQTQVELKLTTAAGTWRMMNTSAGNSSRNPCANKDLPVTIKSSSATELVLQIEGAKVLRGCLNQAVSLQSADTKSLTGSFADGRMVNLIRQ